MRIRIVATVMAALSMAAAAAPAGAQLVPRLVDYPQTRIGACSIDPSTQLLERHRVTYAPGGRRDDVLFYAAPNCADGSLLFTISVAHSSPVRTTITPTAGGVAFLQTRCSEYAWHAGASQDVGDRSCSFVSSTLGSL